MIHKEYISRLIIFGILIITPVLFYHCDDQYTECTEDDYADCFTDEPFEAEIVVYVSINKENTFVPLTIYEGKIDDNNVIAFDTAYEEEFYRYFEIGKYYSVTAKYKSGDKTIYALDGNKMYKKSRTLCDSTCWDVYGGIYNLKLKYD